MILVYSREQINMMKEQLKRSVDECSVCFPKGEMQRIGNHTLYTGESMNEFLFRAVHETMMRDRATGYKVPVKQAKSARLDLIEELLAHMDMLHGEPQNG